MYYCHNLVVKILGGGGGGMNSFGGISLGSSPPRMKPCSPVNCNLRLGSDVASWVGTSFQGYVHMLYNNSAVYMCLSVVHNVLHMQDLNQALSLALRRLLVR